MWLYFIPYLMFLSLAGSSLVIRRADMQWLVFGTVLWCVVFAGIRRDTDNDWNTYLDIFRDLPPLTEGSRAFFQAISDLYLEPVFAFFVSTLTVLMGDKQVFLVISFTSLLIYFFSIRRVAKYPAMAFLMYLGDGFYLREFTQIRFGLAVALVFAGLVALYQGRTWRFRLLVLVGTCFHYTGIFVFACSAWTRLVCTRRRVLVISTVMFALAMAGVFDGLVERLADMGLAPLRLVIYLGSNEASHVSPAIVVLQYLILLLVSFSMEDDRKEYFFVSIYALSFALVCVFSGFDLMRRVSFYFSTSLYVLSSLALEQRRYLAIGVLVAYSAALFAARLQILSPYQDWLL
jgi:hypothetical protein